MAESFSLPIPMMTLLTSGKLAAGKQNVIKEVLILPQPGVPMQKVSCVDMLLFDCCYCHRNCCYCCCLVVFESFSK